MAQNFAITSVLKYHYHKAMCNISILNFLVNYQSHKATNILPFFAKILFGILRERTGKNITGWKFNNKIIIKAI